MTAAHAMMDANLPFTTPLIMVGEWSDLMSRRDF